jgi:predicted NUDIX family NTP pyrophosphohydrolase
MGEKSAGILLYKHTDAGLEVWIAHMGGPFWAQKDAGAWSIPKGLYEPDEPPLAAAIREFEEELGLPAPAVEYELLGEFRQPSGKVVTTFIAESDLVVETIVSNLFSMEWPPRSGRTQDFPEIDDARWFPTAVAREKLVKGQVPIIDALERRLG